MIVEARHSQNSWSNNYPKNNYKRYIHHEQWKQNHNLIFEVHNKEVPKSVKSTSSKEIQEYTSWRI